MRVCRLCWHRLPLESFRWVRHRQRPYRDTRCHDCRRAYEREYEARRGPSTLRTRAHRARKRAAS